jgi:hypothetical protein
MTNHDSLIQLDALEKEFFLWHEVHFAANVMHGVVELGVVGLG